MNFDEEKAMARRIQGGLHGAGLKPTFGQCNVDTKQYAPAATGGGWVGPVTGAPVPNTKWQEVGPVTAYLPSDPITPNTGYLKVSGPPAVDTERMIQMMDQLTTGFHALSRRADARLSMFCTQQPKPETAKQAVDSRQCESDYFRMLESRVEMLNEELTYLSNLIGAVSAPSQSSTLQGTAGLTTTPTPGYY
jgi:hypothetical protein